MTTMQTLWACTEEVLQHHLQSAGAGVDAVMADYVEESILFTPTATYRGLAPIRSFFRDLLEGEARGFLEALTLTRCEVSGEVAYLVWHALPWFPFATDTMLVRNGKILVQTFGAAPPRS